MALIHRATLTPSKLDLLRAWLPDRPWFPVGEEVEQLGAYRFDDPAGEVGVETFLLRTGGGSVVQVPLTYRSGPLAGAEHALIGHTEHSVLGRRWVHDGTADPVWAAALLSAVLTGGTGAAEEVEVDGRLEPREPTVTVRGSGDPGDGSTPEVADLSSTDDGTTTVVHAGGLVIALARVVGAPVEGEQVLTGRWGGADADVVLAAVRRG